MSQYCFTKRLRHKYKPLTVPILRFLSLNFAHILEQA